MFSHVGQEHKAAGNKVRSWMHGNMLRRRHSAEYNATINCKGSGKLFKARKTGIEKHAELDYYIHCVEECDDFKKLNLIQQCKKCNKIFITRTGFSVHATRCV